MNKLKFAFILLSLVFIINFVSAWEFNGTVYDVNGTALFNATINVTIYDDTFTLIGTNVTYSNQTGWFNLTVSDNETWFYQPVIQHFEQNKTDSSTPIDFVGQSLPSFPYFEMQNGLSTNFYLKEAGTINLTAVNATGSSVNFQYIVKDQTLGFPIAEEFQNYVSQKTIYVPRDRNYSIMLFPNNSMPVSFDWNNFSSSSSYNISTPSNNINLSSYNVTTHTLHKQFNVTESLVWVNGYTTNSTGQSLVWDEFTVIPFILEPGNMVFLGDNAAMPYNMSAWRGDNSTDNFSLSTGFYNMTLPGPAENATYLLFATAKNGTNYYGGYRNITLGFGDSGTEINFTMWPLMSTDWGTANSNLTMNDAADWSQVNVSTARQTFNLKNSTSLLSGISAHIEVTVDYSDYNATEFIFMLGTEQSGTASFYVPLINSTGTKEINIYSMNYAPKRVGPRTPAEILANNNITLSQFNPGDVDGEDLGSNLKIALFKSNSTCDVPNPSSSCVIGSSDSEGEAFGDFNPLESIIGGGKLSFRMGLISSGIIVHYVDVDMLASGPPDALFDDSATESTDGTFDSALRFGSLGPTIYDYVLISMPYTEGSSSQTGLDESGEVNISIPLFYDENSSGVMDWNTPIWNTTSNGTNGTHLSGNHTHFSTYSSEWESLMENNTCITNVSIFNSTNPCYIDTTNNRIWIRLPHFSGTKPNVDGSVITASSSPSSSGGGSGGGSSPVSEWAKQKIHNFIKIIPGVASIIKDFDKEIGIKEIKIEVSNEAQNVKITVRKYDGKPASVSIEKSGKTYQYIEINTENLNQSLDKATITIRINKSWLSENSLEKEDISLFRFNENIEQWNELITNYVEEDSDYYYYEVQLTGFSYFAISEKTVEEAGPEEKTEREVEEITTSKSGIVIVIIIIIIIMAAIFISLKKRRKISNY